VDQITKEHPLDDDDSNRQEDFDNFADDHLMHVKPNHVHPLVQMEQDSDDSLDESDDSEDLGKEKNSKNPDHISNSKIRQSRVFSKHEFN